MARSNLVRRVLPTYGRSLLCLCLVINTLLATGSAETGAPTVVNAANLKSGALVPNEIVVIYSGEFGPLQMVPWGLNANLQPTTFLGETRVLFDGTAASIIYSMHGQIGAIVPPDLAGKEAIEVVVEYQGRRSPAAVLPVAHNDPALFTLDGTGSGQAAILNETGCCNSVRNPAVRGSMVSLYATGEGKLPPAQVGITVGDVPAQIAFAGNVGGFQVNFRVPPNAPVGNAVPLVLSIDGQRTAPGVTMAIRSAKQRILIRECNAATRNRLSHVLTSKGYEVLPVSTAREAEALSEQPLDLLIFDLAIAGEDAPNLVRQYREANPHLKTLALAANLNPGALKAADLLDVQAVLTNSASSKRIVSRVRALLVPHVAAY